MSGKHRLTLSEHLREFAVGAFFFGGMAIFAIITIVVKRDTLFEKNYPRQVQFESVSSLAKGDKAVLRGLEVGRVAAMRPGGGGQTIIVTLDITSKLQFHQGYLIEIRTVSALGGKQVYMELGDPKAPLVPDNVVLEGHVTGDLMNEAAKLAKRIGDAVDQLNSVVNQVKDGNGTVHKLLYEDDMYNSLQASFKSLNDAGTKVGEAMDAVKQAGATAQQKLEGIDTVKGDLSKAAESLTKAGDHVSEAADTIKSVVADAQSGKGTVGKLLTDDSLYTDLKSTVADLHKVVGNVSNGDSSLGKIMTDKGELYTSIRTGFDNMSGAMAGINDVVDKVKRGEGTLGRLVADDSLYQTAEETIKEVRGAVSDFREQSPILTFGSFVFGAL